MTHPPQGFVGRIDGISLTGIFSTSTSVSGGGTFETSIISLSEVTPYFKAMIFGNRIVGTFFSDKNGTFQVMQSPDGTNFDSVSTFNVTANQPFGFSVEVVAPFVKFKFTNAATTSASIRLYAFVRTI